MHWYTNQMLIFTPVLESVLLYKHRAANWFIAYSLPANYIRGK